MFNSLMETTMSGDNMIFRWLHLFAGIVWIGHLYYFNFVQGAFMAETDAGAKSQVMQKLAPRALWWFRHGALWTFLTGLIILMIRGHQDGAAGVSIMASSYWINILTGALMATLMFLNVWLIIWPKQKIMIANAVKTAGGAAADPAVPAAAARAGTASRTNVLFSIPMMFFMLAAKHLNYPVDDNSNVGLYWVIMILLIGGIQANAMFGKSGPMTTIKGVITSGFVLTLVIFVINHFTI